MIRSTGALKGRIEVLADDGVTWSDPASLPFADPNERNLVAEVSTVKYVTPCDTLSQAFTPYDAI